MKGLLADVHLEGHLRLLSILLEQPSRRELWDHLRLSVLRLPEIGLSRQATDVAIWQRCQESQLILITANRHDEGPTSLAHAIRTMNPPTALPVFTIGDANRFLDDRRYAERVVDKLLDYLFDMDNYRGTGRLYLP